MNYREKIKLIKEAKELLNTKVKDFPMEHVYYLEYLNQVYKMKYPKYHFVFYAMDYF